MQVALVWDAFLKAVGRSMVSGESTFITQVFAQSNNAYLALAPDSPGQGGASTWAKAVSIERWCLPALDGSAYYTMETQSIGKALLVVRRILRHDDPRARDPLGECLRLH